MSIQPNAMPNNANYTKYLVNPDDKRAFLAGCRAMIDIYAASSPDDLAFLSHNVGEDRLISLLLRQQSYNRGTQRRDAANIIGYADLDKAAARAMIFGFHVNDNGYAVNEIGYAVEDSAFHLTPEQSYWSWPYTLARNKQTGAEISREEYDNLSPEQQENYDVLRYLDLKNEDGAVLKHITEDNETYMAELIAWDIINNRQVLPRYLSECGAGHGNLPRGRFYDYRKTIVAAASQAGYAVMTPMLIEHVEKGYINSLGQYYLALLQSLAVNLTPSRLREMDAYELATLKLLLTTNADEMAYDITDDDIMYYRNVSGDGMKGALHTDDSEGWDTIPASDERCDIYAQKTYICERLIQKLCDIIVEAFLRLDDNAPDMVPDAWRELTDLVKTIAPSLFDEDEECSGDDCNHGGAIDLKPETEE